VLAFIVLMSEILGLVISGKKISTFQRIYVPSSSCETGKGG